MEARGRVARTVTSGGLEGIMLFESTNLSRSMWYSCRCVVGI